MKALRAFAMLALILVAASALAADVRTSGNLAISASASLFPVCDDPVVARVLNEDFRAANRSDSRGGQPVTVTVAITEKFLKPGTMLRDLGGDPWTVANLLRDMGVEPPPLGDTGDKAADPYTQSVEQQFRQPDDPMRGLREYEAMKNEMTRPTDPKFGPNGNAGDDQLYDRAVVATASATGSANKMTAITVVHAGGDVRAAKELLAEEIANAILH